MSRESELKQRIHAALIELCSIADDNEQVLMTYIQTTYLNQTGNPGVNAVIECDVKMVNKDEL